MTEVALSVDRLSLRFASVEAIRQVSFQLAPKGRAALLGPNGAGKTSLLDCISGFRSPDAGTIEVRGRSIHGRPPHSIASLGVARTFQGLRLSARASVLENALVGCSPKAKSGWWSQALPTTWAKHEEAQMRREAELVLSSLGLLERANAPIGDLPQGLSRQVELARALMSRPSLLLLDEPGAGLSIPEKEALAVAIDRICLDRDIALVVVDHDLRFVRSLADRWIVLNRGALIADGPADRVSKDPGVRRVFIGEDS